MPRKTAEKNAGLRSLRETASWYRVMTEAAQDAVFVVTAAGKIKYLNEFGAKYFGVPSEKIVGKSIHDLFEPDLAAENLKNIRHVATSGNPLYVEQEQEFATGKVWMSISMTSPTVSIGTTRAGSTAL